eukprot:6490117-Amphidinium_carterae.1
MGKQRSTDEPSLTTINCAISLRCSPLWQENQKQLQIAQWQHCSEMKSFGRASLYATWKTLGKHLEAAVYGKCRWIATLARRACLGVRGVSSSMLDYVIDQFDHQICATELASACSF